MSKNDTKNKPILKEINQKFKGHIPGAKEKEVLTAVLYKFRASSENRNKTFSNFDGSNLKDYIEDSVRRFTTNIDVRDGIEDWQAVVHTQTTRNKTISVLSKIVQILPIAEFTGRGDEDLRRGQILSSLYDYSEDIDDYEDFMIDILLEAIVKGTAIGYEGHEKKSQAVRDIIETKTGIRIKKDYKKTNKLYGELVRLEDFYPSSVGIKNIKDMPYCFWRNSMPYQQFLQDFASYGRATLVSPYENHESETDDRPEYLDYIGDTIEEGDVEVIRYYNKDTDEYIITANGVWLNPLMLEEEEMEVSPLPFNHKELPFWDIKYELFDGSFFYGKSLPDKLKSIQDVMNVLTNMLLDQSFLTVFKPILTAGFDGIEDDFLRPGRRTPVDTQGLSIRESYVELDMSTPGGWHQFILGYMKNMAEEASVDQVTQGIAGGGDRTTAREIGVAAQGVASMLGLFIRIVKTGIKRKALLRGKNILQFWTDENSPIIQKILGSGGTEKMKEAFNIFKIDNTVMTSGERGSKVIEMYSNKNKLPSKTSLQTRAGVFELQTGRKIEIISIPAEYIRDLDFDIKLVANPKVEETKDMEKALQLEKVKTYLTFFPELVNKMELAAETAEKMGDDPTKILKEQAFGGANPPQPGQPQPGQSPQPQANMSNNMVRGAAGGQQNANNMQQLQNQVKK